MSETKCCRPSGSGCMEMLWRRSFLLLGAMESLPTLPVDDDAESKLAPLGVPSIGSRWPGVDTQIADRYEFEVFPDGVSWLVFVVYKTAEQIADDKVVKAMIQESRRKMGL